MRYTIAKLIILFFLFSFQSVAATLSDIHVFNDNAEARVTLRFDGKPASSFFLLHNPWRVVTDIRQTGIIQGLPLNFNGENLIKRIRTSKPKESGSIRLVFDLTGPGRVSAITRKLEKSYQMIVTIHKSESAPSSPVVSRHNAYQNQHTNLSKHNLPIATGGDPESSKVRHHVQSAIGKVIVAIDAGHGGVDPGAIGFGGLKEKNVTISIARKLKALMDKDPMFRAVLTRDGDYFVSVMGRSEVARKQHANLLVSIHADAAPNQRASGASVWVLSNRRANSEMATWLEQHEKQSELLGGAGDLLAHSQADPYLSQALLDLQFGHSQRVGYDVAVNVLTQLKVIGTLHKNKPEHASLGVLRSPDIPSLLIETGFISNRAGERQLATKAYQQKVALAIYHGLRYYFRDHPLQSQPKQKNRIKQIVAKNNAGHFGGGASPSLFSGDARFHIVRRGETLSEIAKRYAISAPLLTQYNQLKNQNIKVGQRLKLPARNGAPSPERGGEKRHNVVRGDSLSTIAAKYGVSSKAIMQANKMSSSKVILGQTLKIPFH